MSAVSARRRTTTPKLSSPAACEMIGIFAKHNPKSSRAQVEAVGKLVAEFGATAAKLSPSAPQRLVARKAEISTRMAEIVADPEPPSAALKLVAKLPPEASQGEGLGELVSATEGRERLAAF